MVTMGENNLQAGPLAYYWGKIRGRHFYRNDPKEKSGKLFFKFTRQQKQIHVKYKQTAIKRQQIEIKRLKCRIKIDS